MPEGSKLVRYFAGIFVCLAAALFALVPACRPSPAFARAGHGAEACEYKMLLLSEKFADRGAGMKEFWGAVEKAAQAAGLKVKKAGGPPEQDRTVQFLDTKGFEIFKTGHILRRRSAGKDKVELTLKYRDRDPAAAFARDVTPAPETGVGVSFEEDVVARDAGADRMYAKSGRARVSSGQAMTVAGAAEVFPAVAGLGIDGKAGLAVVNGITVKEISVDYGRAYFDGEAKTPLSFAAWYDGGRLIAIEFSFKIKAAGPPKGSGKNTARRNADKFFAALRGGAGKWMAAGQTKTGLIYGTSGGNQD